MIQPTLHVDHTNAEPSASWVKRGFTALVMERRLPWRASRLLDRIACACGFRHKTVEAEGFRVKVRRLTCDEQFVTNIIPNHDYTSAGFAIGTSETVIDIGGNIGTFTLVASRAARDGRVLTFEPNSANYRLLLQNIARNRLTNAVAIHAAVAGHRGKAKLFTAPQGGFHSVIEDRASNREHYELVDAVSLQDIFDDYGVGRCHFLKLDCEGAEYDILYNLPAAYYCRIDKIAMEFHGDADSTKRRAASDALVAHLMRMGFGIVLYTEFGPPFRGGMIRATLNT